MDQSAIFDRLPLTRDQRIELLAVMKRNSEEEKEQKVDDPDDLPLTMPVLKRESRLGCYQMWKDDSRLAILRESLDEVERDDVKEDEP